MAVVMLDLRDDLCIGEEGMLRPSETSPIIGDFSSDLGFDEKYHSKKVLCIATSLFQILAPTRTFPWRPLRFVCAT